MNEENKYLPIGSVVMLKGGSKRCMIIGYLAVSEEHKEKVFDYSGCLYPEGLISSNQTLLFDNNQIEKVYFQGFVDDEQKEFITKLNEVAKNLNNK